MSVQVEDLEEKYMKKLTVEVSAEDFEKALQSAYQKQKKNISIPGFRKGKVPRQLVEKMYGAGIFYEDAANSLLPDAYSDAADESKLDIVSRPEIEITQIEKGKPFIFTAKVAVKPDVELGEYKGVEVPKTDTTVTDEDVEKELKSEQEKNGRAITVEDGAAENGDTVNINYEGRIDGNTFDGGTAENFDLKLGSNSFIPGFEDQIVGFTTGETRDITVTFPEDYHAEDLKGKEAVFTVTVNKITRTEYPEIDDEFAQDEGFDTVDLYKEDLRKNIQERKDSAAKSARRDAAVSKAASNAKIDIPEAMIDTQADRMVDNFAQRLRSQGMSIDQYMQYTGATRDTMRDQLKPQATLQIRNELVLEKVAEVENIEVTDEDVDEEIKKMADAYKIDLDKMKEMIGDEEKENMREDIKIQRAADLLGDNAVEVEKTEEEEKPAEEAPADDQKEE